MSKKVNGNLNGLKSNQIRTLEKLYNKRLDQTEIINQDFARSMTEISREIKRQIAVLVNRKGEVDYVTVGDTHKVMLPDLKRQRVGSTRFRGLRCIHTHLSGEKLTRDDLVDLTLLRLDLMSAITMDNDGLPVKVYSAYANPSTNDIEHPEPWILMEAKPPSQIDENFISLIESLEQESDNIKRGFKGGRTKEKAILIGVTTESLAEEEETMMELEELTKAANLIVLDKIIQKRKSIDAKYFLGKGKLQDIFIKSLSLNADVLIFNQSLNPSQIRSICKATDLKVIDRSMLILDIFSQRAKNKEGKVQVELAQLKYRLPRIVEKDDSLSRLTGGIGGRGPGETKLEENRRAIRKKISNLEKQTNTFRKQRSQKRSRRINNNLPIISLVGYTNAGKSTLLNSITKGNVETRKRMFETLAPTSRRLRLPKDEEVIVNDTVGFIKDLPEDLLNAFKATLEEIQLSDIIIHIVDASSSRFEKQIDSVDNILAELNMAEIPRMIVFNKCDLIGDKKLNMLKKDYKDTLFISAKEKTGLIELLENIHQRLHLKIDAKVYQEAKKNEMTAK
jgi:GTP-binding protein HflX